jgi:glycine hydroxymethyltransferase
MPIMFENDRKISELIGQELKRQETTLSLIASENYAPANILQAVGSVLSNKYAEGLPGKRYYAGCSIIDSVEMIAIERCKALFNAEHANVQPHAGSQANMAVYMSCLQPGDTVMGMDLAAGGHLTHGFSGNFSGQLYKVVSYGVDPETECINYDAVLRLAEQHRPKLIIAGASAYSRTIDFEKFSQIAKSVGAFFLADIAHIAGLVAARLHPSPIVCADFVTSTTHKTLCGPRGAFIMCKKEHAQAIDKKVMPGIQGGPFANSIAAKAICFGNALQESFMPYQKQIITNARVMADTLNSLGYRIVSGGTDNHMFIVDLTAQRVTGKQAEGALEIAGIIVSRSCIPCDTQKPMIGSGIRIGSSAMTTRGMTDIQAVAIAHLIHEVIVRHDDEHTLLLVKDRVGRICKEFPIYSAL